MTILIGLALISMVLYWIGGESWANTKIRDWGVPACIITGLWLGCGWHWSLIIVFFALWGALCLGDYGKWQWSVHAFAVGFSTAFYAYFMGLWTPFIICLVVLPALTYVCSRFIRFFDVFQRGLTFGAIPIIFKLIQN